MTGLLGAWGFSPKSPDDLRNDLINVKPTQKLTHALNTPHNATFTLVEHNFASNEKYDYNSPI